MSTSSLALLPLSCIAQLAECQSDKENIRLCGCGREAGIRTEHDPQILNQTGYSSFKLTLTCSNVDITNKNDLRK